MSRRIPFRVRPLSMTLLPSPLRSRYTGGSQSLRGGSGPQSSHTLPIREVPSRRRGRKADRARGQAIHVPQFVGEVQAAVDVDAEHLATCCGRRQRLVGDPPCLCQLQTGQNESFPDPPDSRRCAADLGSCQAASRRPWILDSPRQYQTQTSCRRPHQAENILTLIFDAGHSKGQPVQLKSDRRQARARPRRSQRSWRP